MIVPGYILGTILGLLAGFCFGIAAFGFIFNENSNINDYELKIDSGRYMKIINFQDHSYVYLINSWNSAGDKLLHNPECKCLKKEGEKL